MTRDEFEPIVVAVVGSRDYHDPVSAVTYFLDLAATEYPIRVRTGEGRGIDAAARAWSRSHGYEPQVVAADWNGPRGKLAGKDRNWDIVGNAARVIAFWDGYSNGTAHAISAAVRLRKPVQIHMSGDS